MLFFSKDKKEKKTLGDRIRNLPNILKANRKAAVLFCVGLTAFAAALFLDFPGNGKNSDAPAVTPPPNSGAESVSSSERYDTYLEAKLAALLKTVEGVGNVAVAVSLDGSAELIPLQQGPNASSEINETDSSGGTRISKEENRGDTAAVLHASDGSESLVVTKTRYPDIIGVVISAEGAGSNVTKERIYKAVQAFCGIDFAQIEILPMQE